MKGRLERPFLVRPKLAMLHFNRGKARTYVNSPLPAAGFRASEGDVHKYLLWLNNDDPSVASRTTPLGRLNLAITVRTLVL
ncbi:hypothetical protein CUJ84_pRLN1000709 (plasmid) [Rhizobium leguminosarum]|uniref:Uncharacterized protein n=1 Tax=Rhizobium leguminosarum TaxID=384 RepID=A0A2K9ZD36_RHILE|nr:hypothetical protein CUJ84_pRLN1000709 [Rhizobium leguminosarum]